MSLWTTLLDLRTFFRKYPSVQNLDAEDPSLLVTRCRYIIRTAAKPKSRSDALDELAELKRNLPNAVVRPVLNHSGRAIEPRRKFFLRQREDYIDQVESIVQELSEDPRLCTAILRASSYKLPQVVVLTELEESMTKAFVSFQCSVYSTALLINYPHDKSAGDMMRKIWPLLGDRDSAQDLIDDEIETSIVDGIEVSTGPSRRKRLGFVRHKAKKPATPAPEAEAVPAILDPAPELTLPPGIVEVVETPVPVLFLMDRVVPAPVDEAPPRRKRIRKKPATPAPEAEAGPAILDPAPELTLPPGIVEVVETPVPVLFLMDRVVPAPVDEVTHLSPAESHHSAESESEGPSEIDIVIAPKKVRIKGQRKRSREGAPTETINPPAEIAVSSDQEKGRASAIDALSHKRTPPPIDFFSFFPKHAPRTAVVQPEFALTA